MISPHTGTIRHDRMTSHSFSGPGLLVAPMYQSLSPTTRPSQMSPPLSRKRSRPTEFDLSVGDMSDFGHASMGAMGPTGLESAYTHTPVGAIHPGAGLTMTHHHHLPNLEPPSKMMRRDDDVAAAPSLVGQEGMPPPAPRPRGPKLKFTAEDDQLLIQLKEQKNLTWKQIADFFPGRSSGTLQVRYCTKLKAKTTLWTEEMDNKLRRALQDYENEKWRIVAHKIGSGFTPAACRERVEQWESGETETFNESVSPSALSSNRDETSLYGADDPQLAFDGKHHHLLR
ncbi:Putative MYB DNA-binding domain protein [[Torrubiella] hemipterigena]|uniref:Putative MYB DNA-binding domain protein n=1 Tax=[Torrubiella] hemipterigena TaxID=1531966 RepID=A0A0A1TBJ3_9HYPO|nr:Putative MYB DNA-binding domain protein [[Torrubiella] hemipterigena]